MLITNRPQNLTFNERNKEKIALVLSWLLEFRVSSLEILSARLGLSPTATTRFFKRLLQRNILERIKVTGCDKRDLVILGPEGHKMLGTSNLIAVAELSRVRKYTKKKTVNHDLEAQKAALTLMPGAMEIVSDFNVKLTEKKPDLLVFRWNPKLEKVSSLAVEMEKTAKGSKAIYYMLNTYLEMIDNKVVDGVVFFFSHEDDLKTYRRYFDRDLWPYTGEKRIKSKTVPATFMKDVKADDQRRKKFVFKVLKEEDSPVIFPLEKASSLERIFTYPYLERLKDQEREPLIQKALEEKKRKEEEVEESKRLERFEEDQERNEVQLRLAKNSEKRAALYAALEKAKTEDAAPRAWLPGYKFQTQSALEALIACLTEQLEHEEKETKEAYELAF